MIVLMALCAGWTYAWTRARDIVHEKFDRFLVQEAKAGRLHECMDRKVGGYPFHIEISCTQSVVRAQGLTGEISVSFPAVKTVAMVYAPDHIITDFSSPLVVKQGDAVLAQMKFSAARASFRHNLKNLQRFSFVSEDLHMAQTPDSPALSAKKFELHFRPSQSTIGLGQNYDFAMTANGTLLPGSVDQALDISLSSTIQNWSGGQDSAAAGLNRWMRNDGKINVQDLRIKRNGGLLVVTGEAHLNEARRLDGRFEAVFVNGPVLLRGLVMQGENDAGALFGPLLFMLGKRVEFEGRRGTQLQLQMNNGVLSLGSLVLAEFPPLY